MATTIGSPNMTEKESQSAYRERVYEAFADRSQPFEAAVGTGAPLTVVTAVTSPDSELLAGDTATVTATVENRGEIAAERTVNLTANGATVTSEAVALPAGETVEIPLTFQPQAGEYDLAVDGVQSRSLTVVGAPTPTATEPAAERQTDTGTTAAERDAEASSGPLGTLLLVLVVAGAAGSLLWWSRTS